MSLPRVSTDATDRLRPVQLWYSAAAPCAQHGAEHTVCSLQFSLGLITAAASACLLTVAASAHFIRHCASCFTQWLVFKLDKFTWLCSWGTGRHVAGHPQRALYIQSSLSKSLLLLVLCATGGCHPKLDVSASRGQGCKQQSM